MLTRSTQTNEPGRCATLLPVLATLLQPIALLEVGASAGLCLIPDRYGYSYGEHFLMPTSHGTARHPTFSCRVIAKAMLPQKMPQVVWRAGIDLNPIDVNDHDQVAWLETLVWPEAALKTKDVDVRFIRPDVALVHVTNELQGISRRPLSRGMQYLLPILLSRKATTFQP